MAFKIVRLEERIAPSRFGCYGGSGSRGKSGSKKCKSGSKGKSGSKKCKSGSRKGRSGSKCKAKSGSRRRGRC